MKTKKSTSTETCMNQNDPWTEIYSAQFDYQTWSTLAANNCEFKLNVTHREKAELLNFLLK